MRIVVIMAIGRDAAALAAGLLVVMVCGALLILALRFGGFMFRSMAGANDE